MQDLHFAALHGSWVDAIPRRPATVWFFFGQLESIEEKEAVRKKTVLTSCQQLQVTGVDAAVGVVFSD